MEGCLSLIDGHGVVEIPRARLILHAGAGLRFPVVAEPVALGRLRRQLFLGFSLLGGPLFLLLLLLQSLYHTVDGLVAFVLRQAGKHLQRVLQIDGIGERHQFVEHLRAFRQLLIVAAVFVQQSDGLAVTALRIVILLARPIEVSELEQQHTFLYTVAHRLLVAFLVGGNGVECVAVCQIDIAYGVVHLVEIVLVVVGSGHAAQLSYHLPRASAGHHLRLRYAGVELQFVWRTLAHHAAVSLVGHVTVSQFGLNLSHEIPHAGLLLLAALVLDGFRQIADSLLVSAAAHIKSGIGIVPVLHGTVVHRVTLHLRYHVFGIVEPVEFGVAACQPRTGNTVYFGLRGIQT